MNHRKFLSVLVAAGVVLAACGSDDNNADDNPSTSAPPPAVTTASDATDTAATGATTVMIATDPTLGEHLVDADGRTLYLFEQDQGTTTACEGGCVDNWPPLIADTPTAGEGVDGAEISTADGIDTNQVTYHGHLLYYFAGDQAAGDTNGVSIPDWYAVDPAGEGIETG